ncbi:hypothetical protein ACFP81_05385 [Deinococcus lacus]|uniref:Uncharacterized protein n=1 Tax=Deinococcus lacus TaxID=392561 RepID=A0ABW1YDJ8_9DEIO
MTPDTRLPCDPVAQRLRRLGPLSRLLTVAFVAMTVSVTLVPDHWEAQALRLSWLLIVALSVAEQVLSFRLTDEYGRMLALRGAAYAFTVTLGALALAILFDLLGPELPLFLWVMVASAAGLVTFHAVQVAALMRTNSAEEHL